MKPILLIANSIAALFLMAALVGCATNQASQANEVRQSGQTSQTDQHKAHHPDATTASSPDKTGDKTAK